MLFKQNIQGKDHRYRNILNSPVRNDYEKLYKKYRPYLDRDFPQQLADNTESRLWELYLIDTLNKENKKFGKHVSKGPDFSVLNKDGGRIWFEAVAPEKGEKFKNIRSPSSDQVILRILSVIEDKYDKYQKYVKEGIVKPDEPYILAINAKKLERPDYPDELSEIYKAVMVKGEVGKENTKIKTGIFFDKYYEGISAIIYLDYYYIALPDDISNRLQVIYNLCLAKNKIKRGWLKSGVDITHNGCRYSQLNRLKLNTGRFTR
ncbi:MAG: hypothetical protein GTO20_00300 [Candidatus Aminicenantes bacterium]|nr:hypothetical protein [Candidatus Aminicenantes bacterium]